MLGGFAWDNRVGENQMFRFSWVFSFPFIIAISAFVYTFACVLFKLINFMILGLVPGIGGLAVGALVYLVLMIIMSIAFMARSTKV